MGWLIVMTVFTVVTPSFFISCRTKVVVGKTRARFCRG